MTSQEFHRIVSSDPDSSSASAARAPFAAEREFARDGGGDPSRRQAEPLVSRLARAARASPLSRMPQDQLLEAAKVVQAAVSFPKTPEGVARALKTSPKPIDGAARASTWLAAAHLRDPASANPFVGLSRKELATIAHDDSGVFTLPERAAARMQSRADELDWREAMRSKFSHAQALGGSLDGLFQEALAHFNELPIAERALYPKGHAAALERMGESSAGGRPGLAKGDCLSEHAAAEIAQATGGPLPGEES